MPNRCDNVHHDRTSCGTRSQLRTGWCLAQDREQWQTQVADLVQDTIQGRLIKQLSREGGLVGFSVGDSHPTEPLGPFRPYLALHANMIAGRICQHALAPTLTETICLSMPQV